MAHLLVLARMAASGGEWLDTKTVSVTTMLSTRYTLKLLSDLGTWGLLEERETKRRGNREFKINLVQLHRLRLPLADKTPFVVKPS
jgi:hypothetical protein